MAAILRPGNAPATRGARGTLIRLIDLVRRAFPKARLLVRLDGGFATPRSSTGSTPNPASTTSSPWEKMPS